MHPINIEKPDAVYFIVFRQFHTLHQVLFIPFIQFEINNCNPFYIHRNLYKNKSVYYKNPQRM